MTDVAQRTSATLEPILDADLEAVGRFLAKHYPTESGPEEWAKRWRATINRSHSGAPNHGFLLRAGDQIVGAYCAIYSTREIDGRVLQLCNLAVWCVEDAYRAQSIRMIRALLRQPGWTVTDLAPSQAVQKLNERLGFIDLDTKTSIMLNVPFLPGRGVRVSSDARVIESTLTGSALTFYRDHAEARWARHIVIITPEGACYVQWRRDSRKGLPLFAKIQYVSDPIAFRRGLGPLARRLLLRHASPATLAEWRVVKGRLPRSFTAPRSPRRMYRGEAVAAGDIDYLYSELTLAP